MADEKLNTGPAENISPEAAEPIATPEQAAASEPQQEQTGPAIPEPGDVVVSFDKINELMAEKRQNARAEVEKAETPEAPEAAASGEIPQPANTEEPKKPRRGRPPKAEKAATEKQNKNAVYCFMDKKRSEGKHYYVYTVVGSAKFLWVYCTRVTKFLRPQSSSDAG